MNCEKSCLFGRRLDVKNERGANRITWLSTTSTLSYRVLVLKHVFLFIIYATILYIIRLHEYLVHSTYVLL